MCGIAGFMGQVENRADVIRNMTEVITHRGPDSDGFLRTTIFPWDFADFPLLTSVQVISLYTMRIKALFSHSTVKFITTRI